MIQRKHLTEEQALHAITHGEFSPDVITSQGKVVIILTQDWCPQWMSMRGWLSSLEVPIDLDVYELLYNKIDCFSDFLDLKENRWKNSQIPYLRYYSEGKLIQESNYVAKEAFLACIGC